jgi:hypothetical protein
MDAEINNVIYMELYLGPKMAHGKYGKTNIVGSIDRDSTVFILIFQNFWVGGSPATLTDDHPHPEQSVSPATYCLSHRYKMHSSAIICPQFNILFIETLYLF